MPIPNPAAHIGAAVYVRYRGKPGPTTDTLERVLVFGGFDNLPMHSSGKRGTWIFTPSANNSWFHLSSGLDPRDRAGHSMSTLCGSRVVMFGGFRALGSLEIIYDMSIFYLNDTWLFDGPTETWVDLSSLLSTASDAQYPGPRAYHSSVALRPRFSKCSCKQSVLMYGGVNGRREALDELWELSCLRETEGQPIYKWLRHNRKPHFPWPSARNIHQAVYFKRSTMILWGGSGNPDNPRYDTSHWLYNASSTRWTEYKVTGYLSLLYDAMPLFHPGMGKVIRIQRGYVHYLETTTKRWNPLETVLASPPLERLEQGKAVFVDSKVLVFAGIERDAAYSTTRVWSLKEVDGMRLWQQEGPPRDSPFPRMYGSWNKVGDSLYLTSNLPLSWEARLGYDWYELLDKVSTISANLSSFEANFQCSFSGWFLAEISYLLKFVLDGRKALPNISTVWQLDLLTTSWQEYSSSINGSPVLYTASESWNNQAIITFGGMCRPEVNKSLCHPLFQSDLWIYFVKTRNWVNVRDTTLRGPGGRVFPSLSQIAGNSFLLFGGAALNDTAIETRESHRYGNQPISSIVHLKNDLFLLSLSRKGSFAVEADWEEIASPKKPPGRVGHHTFVTDNKFFVWGGVGLINNQVLFHPFCLKDMWYFDINRRQWTELPSLGIDISLAQSPFRLCRSVAAVFDKRIISLIPSSRMDRPPLQYPDTDTRHMLVSYFMKDSTWIDHKVDLPTVEDALFTWRNYLIAIKQIHTAILMKKPNQPVNYRDPYDYQTIVSKSKPGCRAGEFANNWGRDRCLTCSKGFYSHDGAVSCSKCPQGLISEVGATSLLDCRCDRTYCKHGKCFVSNSDGQLGAECKCDGGFTGSRCQYPTFIIISVVCLVGIFVLALLFLFLQRMVKYRKIKNLRENELVEMEKVWSIEWSELEILGELDSDSPGSYGDVYKARCRDMVVAVKQLKMIMLSGPSQREFEREVQVMKAVRHPNVVLFLGAGKEDEDGRPFLVMEFMRRGSLTSTLRNTGIYLSWKDQINFCLDTAKGMEFLHSLDPPRIHRDLKSNNLLLSDRWRVKVADFGSARLVKGRHNSQPISRRRITISNNGDDITTPLLAPSSDLSRNVGTLFWRAPEIFSDQPYGTSADVYR